MVSGPITSWQIDGGKVEPGTDFLFLGSKITADSDCSHEIKRCLLLGRKAMTNLDSILKNRDITLQVCIVKAVGFPSGSDGKASVCNAGDPGLIPGLRRSPREENGSPLQYSCLENPMDHGFWERVGISNLST